MDDKEVVLRKISGKFNPANSLTKYTPAHESRRDMAYIMNTQGAAASSDYQGYDQRDDDHAGIRSMLRDAIESNSKEGE